MREAAGKDQKKIYDNLYALPTSGPSGLMEKRMNNPLDQSAVRQKAEKVAHKGCEHKVKSEIEKNIEALKLMQYPSELESSKLLSSSPEAEEHIPNRQEVVLAIRKQLANLKDRGRRIKFYVDEMINAYPMED